MTLPSSNKNELIRSTINKIISSENNGEPCRTATWTQKVDTDGTTLPGAGVL